MAEDAEVDVDVEKTIDERFDGEREEGMEVLDDAWRDERGRGRPDTSAGVAAAGGAGTEGTSYPAAV